MNRKFWITGTLLILSFLALSAFDQDSLPPAATLASVAHATGIRGGDLAEALDFPRAIDKEKPLVEMGVTPDQLRQALTQLGVSEESLRSILGTEEVNPSMTIRQILPIRSSAVGDVLSVPLRSLSICCPGSKRSSARNCLFG